MFMPKKNRIAIYSYLFREGVIVVAKACSAPKHMNLDIPNIHVMDALKSLCSRGFVRETFNWQFLYYYLTDEGIEYLRQYLHLPAETVPHTHKKPARPAGMPERGGDRPERGERRGFGERRPFDDKKGAGGAPGEFRPRFGGGGAGGEEGYRRRPRTEQPAA